KLKSFSGDVKERKVERKVEEIETLNLKLDHKVTKLAAKNEHLKQTYKQLFNSIKSSRVQSKKHCDDLINKVNVKSVDVSDLNASLQERVLVITALKEQLNKLKGKSVLTEAVSLNPIDPALLQVDIAPLVPKLRKNRTAHTDYFRHTQEEAATLREIVESKRLLSPLNTSLAYAVGISHETSVARSPQQNGVVERRNHTLIEAAHTMLIYAQAPLFLWVEDVATDLLFQPLSDELLNPPPSVDNQAAKVIAPIAEVIPQVDADSTGSPSSTTVDQDAPSPSKSLTPTEIQSSVIH
nr:putative ribonuclease H-like domain-containing protein [Tanacetum cinerariifolium]